MPVIKFPCGHTEQISMESYLYLTSIEQPKPPRYEYCRICQMREIITFLPNHITQLKDR